MTSTRRKELKKRYLRAQAVVDYALDNANCGLTLLRFVSPDVEMACREMESIEAEVKQAIAAGER